MSYKHHPLDVKTNRYIPEDDIDTIFSQLQQVEPPQSLIARILTQVSQQARVKNPLTPSLRESELAMWTTQTRQKYLC